jgi:hypothetical protein
MSRGVRNTQPTVTLPERIRWALARLDSACRMLAADGERSRIHVEHVVARHRELEELRALERKAS